MIVHLRRVAGCLLILCALRIAPAASQELRISHQFHESSDSRGRAAQVFATEATRLSPELGFRVHPELSLGLSRDEQLDELQSGKLDLAVLPFIVPIKKIPEFSLTLLPGLVPSLAAARALKGSEVHARLQEIAAANGLRIVTWWWMRGGFATTGKEAAGPASVAGLKFQSCGLVQKLLVDAGAQMSEEPSTEIPMLLDMGALNGVAIPYEDFVNMGLHEHAKFATIGGPSLVTCFTPMLMSQKTWDRLTPKQKQSIEEAAAASDAFFEIAQVETEQRARERFQEAGASVRSLTRDEYTSWLRLARETVWARYAGTNPQSRDLMNTAVSVLAAGAMKDEGGVLASP